MPHPGVNPIPPLGTPQQPEWSQARSIYEAPLKSPQVEPPPERTAVEPALSTTPHTAPQKRKFKLPQSWLFWGSAGVVFTTGLGWLALALLLQLPSLPNCPRIFWPTASASLRMYCAQLAANKQTVADLVEAIELVNSLPADHPMRGEVDRSIEQWATDLMRLTEELFNQGQLEEAIDALDQIPPNATAHKLVQEKITEWREIWADAEEIYEKSEAAIQKDNLQLAFSEAIRLLEVDNTYWQTVKFRELNDLITAARLEDGKIARARILARRGGSTNLIEATKILETISEKSPSFKEVRQLMRQFGRQLLQLAERQIQQGDAQAAIAIARQISPRSGLEKEAQDFVELAIAQSQAWQGTAADLEGAILQAQRLESDRPLYQRAQNLIRRWQLEIQDVTHLERAQQLAAPGSIGDLTAAIAEARLVPEGNPRSEQARSLVREWVARIQTTEDQPLLDEADRLASQGGVNSLQAAINRAGRIGRGRALHADAQQRIRRWQEDVERIQDQPFIDEARRLAALGDLTGAIATASQVDAGRALSGEARSSMQSWQRQLNAQSAMQRAYQSANTGTPEMLLQAIRTASDVPEEASIRGEADRMINIWSNQILRLAEQQSSVNLEQAIAIAQSVPPRTEAYATAQLRVQEWQQWQNSYSDSPEALGSPQELPSP